MLRQLFDLVAHHGGVDNGNADLVLANGLVSLRQRCRIVNVVNPARRILDRDEKLLVLGQDEHVHGPGSDGRCGRDLLWIQLGHLARAIADDRRTVFGRFHDDVFGRLVDVGRGIVSRFGQRHQAHLAGCVVNEFGNHVARHVAAHNLEYFLVTDQRFEAVVGVAGQQDTDSVW